MMMGARSRNVITARRNTGDRSRAEFFIPSDAQQPGDAGNGKARDKNESLTRTQIAIGLTQLDATVSCIPARAGTLSLNSLRIFAFHSRKGC